MQERDNESYWVGRHEKLRGSLASVGKIGTSEEENRQRYARKKRGIADLLRSLGKLDLAGVSVLDAGCGVGMISELLYALGADVHGIDASTIAIAEARDRTGTVPDRTNKFRVGSLIDFNYSRKFDLIFCLDVLYHVIEDSNWEVAVRNLASHTKRDGLLIIIDHLKDEPERPAAHVRFRTKAMYDKILFRLGVRERTPARYKDSMIVCSIEGGLELELEIES